MIQYIRIKNFGPIKDEVELSFEASLPGELSDDSYSVVMPDGVRILRLAYIYGANASGKTTVLNALEFLKRLLLSPLYDKSEGLDYEPFLFCAEPKKSHSTIEMAFYVNAVRHIYEVVFNYEAVLDEKLVFFNSAKPTELFSRKTDVDKRLATIQFGSRIKVPAKERDRLESNTLHNNTVLGAFTKTNTDIPELEELNVWLKTFLLGMISSATNVVEETAMMIAGNPKANEWMDRFMNKADQQISGVRAEKEKSLGKKINMAATTGSEVIEPVIRGVSIKSSLGSSVTGRFLGKMYGGSDGYEFRRKIEFTHLTEEGEFKLPIQVESAGTQRYFSLGGPLYSLVHSNAILLVDELESSLHPDLMKHFLQTFLANAGQSQMLVTTHNVALMEEIDFIRRDALWFSEKKADGSVDLYSAADFDSGVLRKGASLINAYRSGRLGAKPNLGSPFIAAK
ncbi:AAA family ATPase [Pedobacter sp. MR2016-19]|uniref:AAA family ATPase n=1 Tax=Pedobacter sp. MR2016-19 TaxID=2780089 RepID=UPI0018764FFA|nr:AAA family ATPase [Pedobacter sp. MR2016-19]MBE5321117.1 AAA family ATPase [Pedobacter sp. MR2016-19]